MPNVCKQGVLCAPLGKGQLYIKGSWPFQIYTVAWITISKAGHQGEARSVLEGSHNWLVLLLKYSDSRRKQKKITADTHLLTLSPYVVAFPQHYSLKTQVGVDILLTYWPTKSWVTIGWKESGNKRSTVYLLGGQQCLANSRSCSCQSALTMQTRTSWLAASEFRVNENSLPSRSLILFPGSENWHSKGARASQFMHLNGILDYSCLQGLWKNKRKFHVLGKALWQLEVKAVCFYSLLKGFGVGDT